MTKEIRQKGVVYYKENEKRNDKIENNETPTKCHMYAGFSAYLGCGSLLQHRQFVSSNWYKNIENPR
jgi:hypothetical protein